MGILQLVHIESLADGAASEPFEQRQGIRQVVQLVCTGYRQKAVTGQLLQMGCRLEGVPGFYQNDEKDWTLAFTAPAAPAILYP